MLGFTRKEDPKMDPKRRQEFVDLQLEAVMMRYFLVDCPPDDMSRRRSILVQCGGSFLRLRRELGSSSIRSLLDYLAATERDLHEIGKPDAPVLPPPPAVDAALVLKLAWEMDEIEFSVLTAKCLRSKNIFFIDELVQKTEDDLLKTKNFGRPRLREVKTLLATLGLSLGMKLDEATIAAVRAKIVQRGGGTK